MNLYLITEEELTELAEVIREKLQINDLIDASKLAEAARQIDSRGRLDLTPTPSLVYTLSSDGTYYIVGTGFTSIEAINADASGGTAGSGLDSTWSGGNLVIPSEYNGKPVRAIAPKAFNGITNIVTLYIQDGLTTIGHRCFQVVTPYDTTLVSIRLPSTLTTLGGSQGRVFWGRQGLTSAVVPQNITTIENSVFGYCSGLLNVNLKNVTTLGASAFQNCTGITSIDLSKVVTLTETAFLGCRSLKSVELPLVEFIGNNAFGNCSNLTSVTIGPNCSKIDNAGLKCGSSTNKCTFRFLGTTPPSIESEVVFNTTYLNKIIVPAGYGETYKTATNWAALANYIEEATV